MDAKKVEELEKKMIIEIRATRSMMLDQFSAVDQKFTIIEELLKKIIDTQKQIGNPPETPNSDHKNLTEKNTGEGGGVESSTSAYKRKKVVIGGGFGGGPSHKSEAKIPIISWGQKVVKGDETRWDGKKSENDHEKRWVSWSQNMETGWGGKKSETNTEKGWVSWSQKVVKGGETGRAGKISENDHENRWVSWSQHVVIKGDETEWGGKKSENDTENGWGSWGQKVVKPSQPPEDQPEIYKDSSKVDQCGKKDSGSWASWNMGGKLQVGVASNSAQNVRTGKGAFVESDKGNEESIRPVNDGPRSSGPLTATRQRFDMFTSDEQEILTDIEPIMQSIRRIMHQNGYNDGDPLSADDQTYILDNVLSHHPEIIQKIGAGVDYIMVAKHEKFQDSRCFYIVSTDGRKEDFSYRKCLENFVREKYPDKVDKFMPKYFKKPQPRPPVNRDRGSGPDEGRTHRARSGWNHEFSMAAADEAGTPVCRGGIWI